LVGSLLKALFNPLRTPEPVDAQPGGAMFSRGRIPGQTAPGVTLELVLRMEKTSVDAVKMNTVKTVFELAIAASLH
jgi:hypothetical protein